MRALGVFSNSSDCLYRSMACDVFPWASLSSAMARSATAIRLRLADAILATSPVYLAPRQPELRRRSRSREPARKAAARKRNRFGECDCGRRKMAGKRSTLINSDGTLQAKRRWGQSQAGAAAAPAKTGSCSRTGVRGFERNVAFRGVKDARQVAGEAAIDRTGCERPRPHVVVSQAVNADKRGGRKLAAELPELRKTDDFEVDDS